MSKNGPNVRFFCCCFCCVVVLNQFYFYLFPYHTFSPLIQFTYVFIHFINLSPSATKTLYRNSYHRNFVFCISSLSLCVCVRIKVLNDPNISLQNEERMKENKKFQTNQSEWMKQTKTITPGPRTHTRARKTQWKYKIWPKNFCTIFL